MAKPFMSAAGGWPAIIYTLQKAFESGGLWRFYKRMRSKNACKTCALGMGGQAGGMVNEAGKFPEVCKKSVQAQAADMQPPIASSFFERTSLAALGAFSSLQCDALGRLSQPLIADASDSHFRVVSWDDALEAAADGFRSTPAERTFFYSSGRASNEAAFLLQLVARAYGSAHIHNCSYYCHQASSVALQRVYGSGTASVTLDDLAQADLALVIGANPASNHPRLMTQLVKLRRRGGRVIVINPLRELGLIRFRLPSDPASLLFGSQISDLYVQPHVGGDLALFKALLKGLIEARGVHAAFVAEHTEGYDAVRDALEQESWDALCEVAGVARSEIDEIVRLLAEAKRGIFMWAMGLTHHTHGVDNILALANLALARGWVGRPGCGLLPIRGHSNVQGLGSMGVAPTLKDAFAAKLGETYGVRALAPGMDTFACMEAAHKGEIQAALLLGGNLYSSNPDSRWAQEAMARIDCTVYVSTKLNLGHILGRGKRCIILPALARDEESQATTQESMFNYVRLSDGGAPAVSGAMRSEIDIIASLAERILPPERFDWAALRSHRALREAIAQVVPGYAAIGDIDATKHEFQVDGRTFHEPRFATSNGRARFHSVYTPAVVEGGGLRLMTLRSEGQFNTVVFEDHDLYRGNQQRDVVMISARDAERLGFDEGQLVRVQSVCGAVLVHVAIVDIRSGSAAMYYPEANVLVPRQLDPQSQTPAFKNVAVELSAA